MPLKRVVCNFLYSLLISRNGVVVLKSMSFKRSNLFFKTESVFWAYFWSAAKTVKCHLHLVFLQPGFANVGPKLEQLTIVSTWSSFWRICRIYLRVNHLVTRKLFPQNIDQMIEPRLQKKIAWNTKCKQSQ